MQSTGGRGQSTVVSVALLTFVVVVVLGTFGTFYLGSLDKGGPAQTDVQVTVTPSTLAVTHAGGETLDSDQVRVLLRDVAGSPTYAVDADGSLAGSTPGSFDPGESWTVDVSSLSLTEGQQLRVLVVHDESEAVLFNSRVTVREPSVEVGNIADAPAPAEDGDDGDSGDGGDGGDGGGGTPTATPVPVDDSDVYDDFEDGNVDEYAGDTNKFDVVSSPTSEGSDALRGSGGGSGKSIVSTSGLAAYPAVGDAVSVAIRYEGSKNSGPDEMRVVVGSDGGDEVGVVLDSEGQNYALKVFNGGTSKRINAQKLSPDTWYELRIVWNADDDAFTAQLVTGDGTVLVDGTNFGEPQTYVEVTTFDDRLGFGVTKGTAYWDHARER